MRASGLCALLALCLACGCGEEGESSDPLGLFPQASVRLVLVVAVDQLRRDRISGDLPGGIGRLVREGRVYTEAVIDYANTETCLGHLSLVSGVHPGRAGMVGNYFVVPETGERVYCVGDPAGNSQTLGGRLQRGHALIARETFGDWLRAARPGARVFSVSAKDRAAIAMAGTRPDGAYWLDAEDALGFTTSAYYAETLPEWLVAWNGEGAGGGFLGRVPAQWSHPSVPGARTDDFPGEDPRYSRTSPHPLAAPERQTALKQLFHSPFIDDVTLDLAGELLVREQLGLGAQPDLLAVSLSGTDKLGHLYGPFSQEASDALARLDAALGRFLERVDQQVGLDHVLVVLSADHGIPPIPAWLAATESNECGAPGGVIQATALVAYLDDLLDRELGGGGGSWLTLEGYRLTVRRERARRADVPLPRIVDALRAVLEAQPGVRRAWTQASLAEAAEAGDPMASLYLNSRDPERSGDIEIQLDPTCLLWDEAAGTNHGSPYLYDRAIPIVLRGPLVEPGPSTGPARSIDIAPTLALILGIETPADLDGAPLPLRD